MGRSFHTLKSYLPQVIALEHATTLVLCVVTAVRLDEAAHEDREIDQEREKDAKEIPEEQVVYHRNL